MSSLFCFMSNKNYAMGHTFSLKDMFMNFPVNKLKMTKQQCTDIYSDGNKRDLAAQIFARSMEIIVDDIIENNVHFKLPGRPNLQSYIYMKRTSDQEFKKAFRNGKWNDVDFIESNFSGYQLTLETQYNEKMPKSKSIYLSAKDRDRITEYTNNGKQY